MFTNTPSTMTTTMTTELNTHFLTVKTIADTICNTLDKPLDTKNKSFLNYEHIHIDNNQRNNSLIRYPPVLISKGLNKIQTNVGFLVLGDYIETDEEKKDKLVKELKLKKYNNNYYYVDSEPSHSSLEYYHTLNEVVEEWSKL